VKASEKSHELVEIPYPESSFICLESLARDKSTNKTYYVVLVCNDDQVKMGRGHDC